MGPLRFELRSEDPQSPRISRLPYGPLISSIFILFTYILYKVNRIPVNLADYKYLHCADVNRASIHHLVFGSLSNLIMLCESRKKSPRDRK
jgi:hypothetical protein